MLVLGGGRRVLPWLLNPTTPGCGVRPLAHIPRCLGPLVSVCVGAFGCISGCQLHPWEARVLWAKPGQRVWGDPVPCGPFPEDSEQVPPPKAESFSRRLTLPGGVMHTWNSPLTPELPLSGGTLGGEHCRGVQGL